MHFAINNLRHRWQQRAIEVPLRASSLSLPCADGAATMRPRCGIVCTRSDDRASARGERAQQTGVGPPHSCACAMPPRHPETHCQKVDFPLPVGRQPTKDAVQPDRRCIGEFLAKRDETTRARIAARAEMRTLSREMQTLVDQLDALNRHRFLGDSAMLTVWRSTRRLRAGASAAPANSEPTPLPAGTETMMLPSGPPVQ